jgi:hypothetical protein
MPDAVRAAADPVVAEALDVVAHDSVLISAKIHRALHGRDEFEHGEGSFDEDPVQSDWNGPAKVALISIERSETAWRAIAAAVPDPIAGILADQLAELRSSMMHTFPRATAFVRPGFDEPWR